MDGPGVDPKGETNGNRTSYADPEGRTTNSTFNAFAQVAEELVSGAVAVRYTHGLQRISQTRSGTTHFYGYDGGGSVRQLTDAAGAVTDTYTYDGFGVLISGTGSTVNGYRYRGEQWDSSAGMYYLRARWYRPDSGRFWTADHWEPNGVSACCKSIPDIAWGNAHHLFGYASDDPVNYIDPSGQMSARIMSYHALREFQRGMGLHAHHIIEKRFVNLLVKNACMLKDLAMSLTPDQHAGVTARWRKRFPYGKSGCVSGPMHRVDAMNGA